jgi:tRNA 2-selenouridine synthase
VSVQHHPFEVLVDRLGEFDSIIDTRSPGEFALDHLPGAINLPVLDDSERAEVGTLYKQVSPFAARKRGAALVARNIARYIESDLAGHPKDWKPLVYCWRGGERSGAMAHILARIGWRTTQLAGGYKSYRRAVIEGIDALGPGLDYRVLCGPTGSGKSRLLAALSEEGAQVLDLEGLAVHRGSVLGSWPDDLCQPSQRAFESRLWAALRALEPGRTVFVESESRKVGDLRVPITLSEALHKSPCVELELPLAERVALLMEDYAHLIADPPELQKRLGYLTVRHGRQVIAAWTALIAARQWPELVGELLRLHYDPAYRHSSSLHFAKLEGAQRLRVPSAERASFARAAKELLARIAKAHPAATV